MASRDLTSVMRLSLIYTMILTAQCLMPDIAVPHLINFAPMGSANVMMGEQAPMGSHSINFAPMGNPEPMDSKLYCKDAVKDIDNCCTLPKLIPETELMKCDGFVEEAREATRVRHAIGQPAPADNPFRGRTGMKPESGEPENEEPEKDEEKEETDNLEDAKADNDKDSEDNDEEKTPLRKGRSAEEDEEGDIKTVYSSPPKVYRVMMEPAGHSEGSFLDTTQHELVDKPNPEAAMMTFGDKEKRDPAGMEDASWGSGCAMDCVFVGLKLSTKEGKIDYDAVVKMFQENSKPEWHRQIEQAVGDCRDGVIKASAEAYVMQHKCRPNAQILLNCVNKKLALTCPDQFMLEKGPTCEQKFKRVEMCQPFMIPPSLITAGLPTLNPQLFRKWPTGIFPGDPPSMDDGEVHTMSDPDGSIYQAPMGAPEVMMPILAAGFPRPGGNIQPNYKMMKNENVPNGRVFKNNNEKSMNQGPKNINENQKGKNQGQNIMNQGHKNRNGGQNQMQLGHRNMDESQKNKKQGQNHMMQGQRNDGQKNKNQGQNNRNQGTKQTQNGRDGKHASRDGINKASLDKVQGTRAQSKPMGEKDSKKNAGKPEMGMLGYVKITTPGRAPNKSEKRKSLLSNSNGPRDM